MEKKLVSVMGTRSAMRSTASPMPRPMVCASTTRRNSERSGSGDSVAMTRRQSPRGSPALTPRMMMSTALGNSAENLASRRFFLEAEHPGRDAEPAHQCARPGHRHVVLDDEQRQPEQQARHRGTHKVAVAAPVQAGLLDADLQRRLLLAAVLDLLQAVGDLLAPARRIDHALDADALGAGRRDGFAALLGLDVARQVGARHEEQAAERHDAEPVRHGGAAVEGGQGRHHSSAPCLSSARSSAAARRSSSP